VIDLKKKVVVSLFSTFLILSGCGTEGSKVEKNNTEGTGEVTDTNNEVTESVVFNGIADPHTMEVKKGGDVISIQFNPEIIDQVEKLEEGKEYQMKYVQNENSQLELIEILK
jgi:PBP1b-binding outer membrane lipoprotein LpoB